jgi:carbonic anhydrase
MCALQLAASPVGATDASHHWSYVGKTGPSHWQSLESDYAVCGVGKVQSPIDIHTAEVKPASLSALSFDYRITPLRIIDNGHSVQVNVGPGSSLTVGGKRYELVQFHFHKPSEEMINGRRFAMVAHLVHRDAAGHLAVVAILLRSGTPNALIAKLWRNLPKRQGHEVVVKGIAINPAQMLPASRGYYAFQGSLTTPPCAEGVRWFVLKTPVNISTGEVAAFGKLYPSNARPVQPLNGREILSTR